MMHATCSRRAVIRRAAILTGYGAVAASGFVEILAFAQTAKVAQKVAQYQTTPKDKAQCNNCASFITPSSCKLVDGTISPSGWCTLYAAKT
jgi:hypothetical protein